MAGLFSVLNYMLKDNGRNLLDYRVVLQKYIKRDQGMSCITTFFIYYSYLVYGSTEIQKIVSKDNSDHKS